MAVLTLVSRATGFARGIVIAAVLGPTFFGNLFVAANSLPNLIFELVIGSVIVSLLVPPLVTHLDLGDRAAARRIACGSTTNDSVCPLLSPVARAASHCPLPTLSIPAR